MSYANSLEANELREFSELNKKHLPTRAEIDLGCALEDLAFHLHQLAIEVNTNLSKGRTTKDSKFRISFHEDRIRILRDTCAINRQRIEDAKKRKKK
jgi:tRNA G10  N-methylase Trm11